MTNPIQVPSGVELNVGETKPRQVYLAAPFFNEDQIAELMAVEGICREVGISFFSPRLECRYRPGDSQLVADKAFYLNKFHITHCAFVLAGLSTPDTGTSWELGYAHKVPVPIVGYTKSRSATINLMLRKTVTALIPFSKLVPSLQLIDLSVQRGRGILVPIIELQDHSIWEGEME